MSMKLNDALITSFSIDDKEYDIDLSFNKVLDVFEILNEEEMTPLEQAQLIVHLLTGQELYDIKEVVDCWIYIKEHFLGIEKETVQYDLL
ncbi:bacteriophage Gp15 family protein, partial [Streptococcus pneumoniae]|nr:bacteriophage Gp15 family protein [Streptococcus pneumoniae]